jgi:Na+-transporting methylmalonyl-CoA/oxaloacetate decarboxylase gamma subunit
MAQRQNSVLPVEHASVPEIIQVWRENSKRQDRNHRIAVLYYRKKRERWTVPMVIISVILGSSSVGNIANDMFNAQSSTTKLWMALVAAAIMWCMSISLSVLEALVDSVWKFDSHITKHTHRAKLHNQFAIKCDTIITSLCTQSFSSVDIADMLRSLLKQRQDMVDRAEFLSFPPHPDIEHTPDTITPMLMPNLDTSDVKSQASEESVHRLGAVDLKASQRRMSRMLRVARHKEMGKQNSSMCASQSEIRTDPFIAFLSQWYKWALEDNHALRKEVVSARKKDQRWRLAKALPSTIITIISTSALVKSVVDLNAETIDTSISVTANGIVIVMLILRIVVGVIDAMEDVLSFKQRAETAENHAKQLQTFANEIEFVIIQDEPGDERLRTKRFEELSAQRNDIQQNFPITHARHHRVLDLESIQGMTTPNHNH